MHIPNMKALSILVQKLWPIQTHRQTDRQGKNNGANSVLESIKCFALTIYIGILEEPFSYKGNFVFIGKHFPAYTCTVALKENY